MSFYSDICVLFLLGLCVLFWLGGSQRESDCTLPGPGLCETERVTAAFCVHWQWKKWRKTLSSPAVLLAWLTVLLPPLAVLLPLYSLYCVL